MQELVHQACCCNYHNHIRQLRAAKLLAAQQVQSHLQNRRNRHIRRSYLVACLYRPLKLAVIRISPRKGHNRRSIDLENELRLTHRIHFRWCKGLRCQRQSRDFWPWHYRGMMNGMLLMRECMLDNFEGALLEFLHVLDNPGGVWSETKRSSLSSHTNLFVAYQNDL